MCTQGDLLLAAAGPANVVNKALDRVRSFLGQELGEVDASQPRLLWVTDFPLFELNEEEQRLEVRTWALTPVAGECRILAGCTCSVSSPRAHRAASQAAPCSGTRPGAGRPSAAERGCMLAGAAPPLHGAPLPRGL